ncbi:MAG: hypothetical protein ACXW2Q_13095, partial [Thermoanaerobaculia bacterium]
TASPPAAAIDAIRRRLPADRSRIVVEPPTTAFAEAMLPEYSRTAAGGAVPIFAFGDRRHDLFLREGTSVAPGAWVSHRAKTRLWSLARQRYFDVSVVPVGQPLFGDGWYAEESDGKRVWRWMRQRGVIELPASIRPARLRLRMESAAPPATMTIAIDGATVEWIRAASGVVERTYAVRLWKGRPSALTITTDRLVVPAESGASSDTRELGLRLDFLQLEIEPQRHPDPDSLPVLHRR